MIEWNRVTWYSKMLAVVLFVAIFALGGYLGVLYAKLQAPDDSVQENILSETKNIDTTGWTLYHSNILGIELKYPSNYEVLENHVNAVPDIPSGPLLIREKGKETTGNTIAFTKVKSTLSKIISDAFSWRVTSVVKGEISPSYIISYFTGDAFSVEETHVYIVSPLNPEEVPMDIFIVKVDGIRDAISTPSTVENIVNTLKFVAN